jgi:hypothetical protein
MEYTFHYHSNGSFLLTGEYLVEKGSQAIVLPSNKGQTLIVKPIEQEILIWESIYEEETLFTAVFSTDRIDIIESTDGEEALFVRNVIRKAMDHLASLSSLPGHHIKAKYNYSTHLDPGTRSALIAGVAEWFNINPFRLNREIMRDAGYGIAAARSSKPVLYQLVGSSPDYDPIFMKPPLNENIYLVYYGGREDLSTQREKLEESGNLPQILSKIREINGYIIKSVSLDDFEQALLEYEQLFCRLLNEKRFQDTNFSDFPGYIKPVTNRDSQFLLVTWKGSREELRQYFAQTLFSWNELIKNE